MPVVDGLPQLRITGIEQAMELIANGWPTRIVSIIDPGAPPFYDIPSGGEHHLVLKFNDVDRIRHGTTAPSTHHMEAAIALVAGMTKHDRLLVHCMMGSSRSPAMAISLLASLGATPAEAVAIAGAEVAVLYIVYVYVLGAFSFTTSYPN